MMHAIFSCEPPLALNIPSVEITYCVLSITEIDIEDKDEYYNMLTEYLLLTKEGQTYIQDIKFNKLPINDYNITVCIDVRRTYV